MNQLDQLLDVPYMPRTHLGDEHLMCGRQLLTDDAGHAHRRVKARRRRQHAVFHRQNVPEQKLRACLAVAARDADLDQVRHRVKPRLRVLDKLIGDVLFQRRGNHRRQHQQHRFKCRKQIRQHRRNPQQDERQQRVHRGMDCNQPLDALGHNERLLRLLLARPHDQQQRHQRLQQQRQPRQPAHDECRHACRRHRDRRKECARRVALHAFYIARQLIALQLQIVHDAPTCRCARTAQRNRLQYHQKKSHALPSSRKFFTMRKNR